MTPMQIAAQAKQYWKETYPKAYAAMQEKGMVEEEALAAANLTLMEMKANMLIGMTEQEAWQASREYFVMKNPTKYWYRKEGWESPVED